jgi:crossover junction endodeoxyribonuclease RuvC
VRVLGIDPGVAVMGYGVVERVRGKFRLVTFGVIRTPVGETHARRLMALRSGLVEIATKHAPEVVAVERLFFTTNVKTAMAVGQASGVALATAAEAGLEVTDYTPNEVKQSVVGYGGATKSQVQSMVAALLGLDEPPRPPDAADACALAICHLNRSGLRAAIGRATG